jgi:RHS repeat-associated protein
MMKGELASISYPQCSSGDGACTGATASRTIDYVYDRGLLSQVPGWVKEIDYSANGRIARVKHGNAVEEIQKNDEDGQLRPQNIQVKKGQTVHWDTSTYQYDGTGNIKAIGTETFKYDGVSRLVEGRVLQLAPSTFQTEALGFDAFGNLTSRSVSNAANSAPAVNPATNRLTGATYDASGNLLRLNATSTEHTFDVLDEMRQRQDGSTVWQYLYTADGERVIERNPATGLMRWTLRDPANRPLRILEHQPAAGTWSLQRDYIYAAGRLVASVGSEGPRHYHLDHLGSIRLETNTTGEVVKQRNFLPFGQELPTAGLTENDLRFTGHERDDVVAGSSGDELDYMHARFCSPTAGRFLSLDPVLGRAGAPQSWNRYAYVRGNPVKLVDRNGEHPAAVVGFVAAVEIGSTAYDVYDTVTTVTDPQESGFNKILSGGGLALGISAPLGGYGKIAKIVSSKLEDLPLIGRLFKRGAQESTGAALNPKIYVELEKQLERDGAASILKSLRSAEKTLESHKAKLSGLEHTSQVESTIKNVERQIETLKQFIKDKELQ